MEPETTPNHPSYSIPGHLTRYYVVDKFQGIPGLKIYTCDALELTVIG